MKVLIVDDMNVMRNVLNSLLKNLGYNHIVEAKSGHEAIDILNRQKIDLIITDYNMPGMDGLELIKEVRFNEALKHIPVLFVTAEFKQEIVVKAAHAGANGYILKPLTQNTLENKLNHILKPKTRNTLSM